MRWPNSILLRENEIQMVQGVHLYRFSQRRRTRNDECELLLEGEEVNFIN